MKKMKFRFTLLCLLFCVLFLSSCVISKNPLGKIETAISDPNLIGTWQKVGKQEYLIITKTPEKSLIFLETTSSGVVAGKYWGYVSEIGKERFLNIKNMKNLKDEYLPAHYRIDDNGDLIVSFFNTNFFKRAVQNGFLEGEIIHPKSKTDIETVKLTESTKNLKKFIRKYKSLEYISVDPSMIYKYKKVKDKEIDVIYRKETKPDLSRAITISKEDKNIIEVLGIWGDIAEIHNSVIIEFNRMIEISKKSNSKANKFFLNNKEEFKNALQEERSLIEKLSINVINNLDGKAQQYGDELVLNIQEANAYLIRALENLEMGIKKGKEADATAFWVGYEAARGTYETARGGYRRCDELTLESGLSFGKAQYAVKKLSSLCKTHRFSGVYEKKEEGMIKTEPSGANVQLIEPATNEQWEIGVTPCNYWAQRGLFKMYLLITKPGYKTEKMLVPSRGSDMDIFITLEEGKSKRYIRRGETTFKCPRCGHKIDEEAEEEGKCPRCGRDLNNLL